MFYCRFSSTTILSIILSLVSDCSFCKKVNTYKTIFFLKLVGPYLQGRLMHYLHLYHKEGAPSLTSLSGLLDVGLFIHLLLAGTILHATWTFGLRLFRTFQTEVRSPLIYHCSLSYLECPLLITSLPLTLDC